MKINHLISTKLTLCLALSYLVFSYLAPLGHIHDPSHREFENAEFHLHITYDGDRKCSTADEEQQTDDHHWFELSHEVYAYICVPILHQGFSPDNIVKQVSQQFPLCSPRNSSLHIPSYTLRFERGSPSEAHYTQIIPHFFTDLSPPLV